MKLIKTKNAIGQILCHDITQIIPDSYKGARFRKGHIIKSEDVELLLSMGKENIYIWEKKAGMLYEEEAAEILCNLAQGKNIRRAEVHEGKIELFSLCDGLLKVKTEKLFSINNIEGIVIATKKGNERIKEGNKIAGLKVVPLTIEEILLEKAKAICAEEKLLEVIPFSQKKVGLIVTGSEVYHKRIADAFTPVIKEKLSFYNTEIADSIILDDDHKAITEKCLAMIANACDFIICTGGMSVDPDDRTPLAIKNTGAEIVSYGAPVLPGGMMLLAYYPKDKARIPIIGLPACVMYYKKTAFDIILPRIMANDEVTKTELAMLGEGGLL